MDTQTQSDKADRLFDITLEVEGLLALIRRREDFTAPEVYTLLLDKVAALAEGVGELCPDARAGKETATGSQALTKEQKFLDSVPSLPGLWDDVEETKPDAVNEAAEEPGDVSSAEPEVEMEHEVSNAEREAETPAEESAGAKIADAVLFETEEDADEAPAMVAEERAPHHRGDLRRSFTINDKFRFRRELFGNSDSEFTDALNMVEAMSTYDEAEDYFINDLGWNREMPEVGEFLAVIEGYFN